VSTLVAERATTPRSDRPVSRRSLPAHWPLTVLVVGFPLWWVLGLSALLPLALMVPMAVALFRRRPIHIPRGFGFWLLFLAWVAASVVVLWVDAPGAVPGGGLERLLVYLYRLAWYLACTVVLLWLGNLNEREVSTTRILRLFGWMFIMTVAGGLLGVLAPRFELTSLVEAVLPRQLSNNPFVNSLVHPASASIQTFLGREEARPIAPFAYANSWGSNLSIYLPFFLASWFGKSAGWRRYVAPVVLAAAVVPIVYSLNRGLWVSLMLGAIFGVIWLGTRGRLFALITSLVILVIAVVIFSVTPLQDLLAERLDSPHSNERRGQLLVETVASTAEGSPIVGFGGPRDVQGSFASIAGGATPDCPACDVPPLGTQGQLWMVIFSQGFIATAFFLAFFGVQIGRSWRARTKVQVAGMSVLFFFLLQLFIYDTLGMPLYTVMVAIALMWRAHRREQQTTAAVLTTGGERIRPTRTLELLVHRTRTSALLVIVLMVAGAAAGVLHAKRDVPVFSARTTILLAPAPVYVTVTPPRNEPRDITVDTEAAMVLSDRSLTQVSKAVPGTDPGELRERIRVTAAPNTRTLTLDVLDEDPHRAEQTVAALSQAYLDVRRDYLKQRRAQVLQSLREGLAEVGVRVPVDGADAVDGDTVDGPVVDEGPVDATIEDGSLPDSSPVEWSVLADELHDAVLRLTLTPDENGEVLRTAPAAVTSTEPQVNVAGGTMLGLLAAAMVVGLRSGSLAKVGRRYATSRSTGIKVIADVGSTKRVVDTAWSDLADLIGRSPCVCLIVPVDGAAADKCAEALAAVLRRRGHRVALEVADSRRSEHEVIVSLEALRDDGWHVVAAAADARSTATFEIACSTDYIAYAVHRGRTRVAVLDAVASRFRATQARSLGVILDGERNRRMRWLKGT
jgi:capsular polysaccharide biosynthesis protein